MQEKGFEYPEHWNQLKQAPPFLLHSRPFTTLSFQNSEGKKLNSGSLQIELFPKEKQTKVRHLGSALFFFEELAQIASDIEKRLQALGQKCQFQIDRNQGILSLSFPETTAFAHSALLFTFPTAQIGHYELRESLFLPSFPSTNFPLSEGKPYQLDFVYSAYGTKVFLAMDQHAFRSYAVIQTEQANLDFYLESFLKQNELSFTKVNACEFNLLRLSQFLELSDRLRTQSQRRGLGNAT
ncbi:hypothetical protein LPTSP4_26080 [Leptospira ryugenii]|uniref:Uncharacterized protein n=2 Tax=Leptospira ryugenii TaxID=1917863 RepID=A0A2P2E2H0_9LEPT|nr:hypothetical protein LPTSP4_26080 [Leptospira ryugenii]